MPREDGNLPSGKEKVFFEYDAEAKKKELQEVEAALEYFRKKLKEVSDPLIKFELSSAIEKLEAKKKRLEDELKLMDSPEMYRMLKETIRTIDYAEVEDETHLLIPAEILPEMMREYNALIGEYVDTKRKDIVLKLLHKFLPYLTKDAIRECGKNVEKALRTNNAEYLSYQEAYNIIELINKILTESLRKMEEEKAEKKKLKWLIGVDLDEKDE